jgi:hypothetical protein
MSGELRQYRSKKVVGSWITPYGATDILHGRVLTGDFLTTARDNPDWVRENDGHSNGTRTRNPNDGGMVTVILSASSPTNSKLSRLQKQDRLTEDVVGALTLKDLNGDTVVVGLGCFLTMIPMPTFAIERGSRLWTWECTALETFLGGHDLA